MISKYANILLAEDNPDDETLTVMALQENKFTNDIIVVRDGAEAIEYLFREGRYFGRGDSMPELILLDLKLPKVNGFEVLKRIRTEDSTRHLPVVVFTSSKEDCDVQRGYALGCNSFVQKPVDFADFSQTVRHLGLYWMHINEMARPGESERNLT